MDPDSTDLIEAVVTATDLEKMEMPWDQLKNKNWKYDLVNEISGNYKKMLLAFGQERPTNESPIVGEHEKEIDNEAKMDNEEKLNDKAKKEKMVRRKM